MKTLEEKEIYAYREYVSYHYNGKIIRAFIFYCLWKNYKYRNEKSFNK